jgi:hypothetical protein
VPTPQPVLLIDTDPVPRPSGVRGPAPTPLEMPEIPTHSDRPRALISDGESRFSDLGEWTVAEHASDYRRKGHTGFLPGWHMSSRHPGRGTAAAHDPVGRRGTPMDFSWARPWPSGLRPALDDSARDEKGAGAWSPSRRLLNASASPTSANVPARVVADGQKAAAVSSRRFVTLDQDSTADGWLNVVVQARTGVFYQQQYGGHMWRQGRVEGFLVPAFSPDALDALGELFEQDFGGGT